MRILIIEDDRTVVAAIQRRLHKHYIVDAAFTGKGGLHLAQVCDYDLILLDLSLPDTTGLAVCQLLRTSKIETPILMLTGEGAIDNKVGALDAGADDYLTKPFDFAELKARIRALLRRKAGIKPINLLAVGDITLDPVQRIATRQGELLNLRRKEFDLLEFFMRNRGKVINREKILENVWDDEHISFTNIVDVHIKYLRDHVDRPFGKRSIKTIHGVGYRLEI